MSIGLIPAAVTLSTAPITALTLLPLIALGLNYYRYRNTDPETRPIDKFKVQYNKNKNF